MRNSCESYERTRKILPLSTEVNEVFFTRLTELELSFVYVDPLHKRQHDAHRIRAAID